MKDQAIRVDAAELPLLEPDGRPISTEERCHPIPDAAPQVLRAGSSDAEVSASVEIGAAVLQDQLMAIFGYRTGTSAGTESLLAVSAGTGFTLKEISLGQVHGAVEPPQGFIHGGALFVLLQDSEAMSQRVRLVRVDSPFDDPKLVRGLTLSIPRDDSPAIALTVSPSGTGLLVWDEYERSSERSRIKGLAFDSETLVEKGPIQTLTDRDEDAEQPKISVVAGAFLLSYLRLRIEATRTQPEDLVVEPEGSLYARKINESGRAEAQALAVSQSGEHVLAFDALGEANHLLLAFRRSRAGNTVEGQQIEVATLALDGSVNRSTIENELLGPGAPVLFQDEKGAPWLVARGSDAELLFAEFGELSQTQLHLESALSDHIPLARSGSRLLTMKPLGLDWSLQIFDCAARAP